MLAERIIHNQESEVLIQFKEWVFSFPNSPDYEYLTNEDKLVIEYKGKRIVEFTFLFDRLHVKPADCLLSIGDKNVSLKCALDEFHGFM